MNILWVLAASFLWNVQSSSSQTDSVKVDSLIQQGIIHFGNDPVLSIQQLMLAVDLSVQSGYQKGEARSNHLIAQLLLRKGQLDSALVLLNYSSFLYSSLGDSVSLAKTLISEADVYMQKRDYERTLLTYTKALRILEAKDDKRAQLVVLRRIGDFLWKTDDDLQSLKYFNEALALAKATRDTSNIVQLYISLGNLNSKNKNLRKSIAYFDSAVSNPKYISIRQQSAIYNSLGIVNYDSGRFEESLKCHLKSKELKEILGDSVGLSNSWQNLGNTYQALHQSQQAENALLKSLELASRLEQMDVVRVATLNLSRLYESNGKYERALHFIHLYDSLNQQIFNQERASQLAEIREEYEAEKKETEIRLLKKNEEIQTAVSSSRLLQRNFLIGATILLFVIVGLVYMAYQQKRKSNIKLGEQNAIITKREKEKELLLYEVNHRVKNNLQMVSGLLRLLSHSLSDSKAAEAAKEGQTRVDALALIHKKVFENGDHNKIMASEYFSELMENLLLSTALPIQTRVNLEDIELDVDQAVPVALIVNELITNALKYAFNSDREGILEFSMIKKGEEQVELSLQDNGKESYNPDLQKESMSFGINLVYTLAAQLKGNLSLDNTNGTKWNLVFPQLK